MINGLRLWFFGGYRVFDCGEFGIRVDTVTGAYKRLWYKFKKPQTIKITTLLQ